MNQAAQDKFVATAARLLPGFSIDRCKHASLELPALWVFRDGVQVGSCTMMAREPVEWKACRMVRGMPTSERRFIAGAAPALLSALEHIRDGAAWQREGRTST